MIQMNSLKPFLDLYQNDQTRRANETPNKVIFCAQPAPAMQI